MAVDTSARTPAGRAARRAPRKQAKPKRKRGFFRRFWWVFLAVPLAGGLILLGSLYYVYANLELPEAAPPLQTTYVYDRDGRLVTTFHSAVDRTLIRFSDMPQSLRDAVIAAEDQDFYAHSGFDPIGIGRAAWNDLVLRRTVQGGSTITQQLVKNVYAGTYVTNRRGERVYRIPDRTVSQKVREVLLAIKLEQEMGKDRILATYLNTIYFGHGAYGVEAAAQTYWSKPASELNVLQSATLAGIVASPELFDPADHPADARVRRDYVLDRMVAEGYLDAAKAARLQRKPVRTDVTESTGTLARPPYFLDYVKQHLIGEYGEEAVFGGGLRVTTTLDREMQDAAEQAIRSHLTDRDGPQAALVAIDPRTGAVRAMVGGRNFRRSQVNVAIPGRGSPGRSPGSTFKVVTLATALDQGVSLGSTWAGPSTITIPDKQCYTHGGPWRPSNAGDSTSGTFTLLSATANSVNTVFAQLVTEVGPENVVDMAHDLGVTAKIQPNCAITLGSEAVTPLEMTNVYATIADRGVRHEATPFQKVEDAAGAALQKLSPKDGKRVLNPNEADAVTYALQGVIVEGTGTAASLGRRPAAGKTGSAQGNSDAWFCGYTPQLAACVWMGYLNDNRALLNVEGVPTVYGGTIPAAIWQEFMMSALEDQRVLEFVEPDLGEFGVRPTPSTAPAPTTSPQTPSEQPEPKPTKEPKPTETEEPSPSPTASEGG